MKHSKDIQGLFDPVVTEIINLVRQQVKEARKKKGAVIDVILHPSTPGTARLLTINIQRIILVGGFGESPYLNKALAKWCNANGGMKLMCPEQP